MSAEQMQAVIHDCTFIQIELEDAERAVASQPGGSRKRRASALSSFMTLRGWLSHAEQRRSHVQANLTSVAMLGVERSRLVNLSFSRFVSSEDQEAYYHCWRKVSSLPARTLANCDCARLPAELFHGRLEAVQAIEGGAVVCRMTLSDITRQKRSEEQLRESERRRLKHESEEWNAWRSKPASSAPGSGCATGRITCSAHACEMLDFQRTPSSPGNPLCRASRRKTARHFYGRSRSRWTRRDPGVVTWYFASSCTGDRSVGCVCGADILRRERASAGGTPEPVF